MTATPFSTEQYLKVQKKKILDRVNGGTGRLYLEFGGKLLGDYHAARVLPGYDPDVKVRLLKELSSSADILICIHAEDIERKKIRADFGITYDNAALKQIDGLREFGIEVTAVVITRFSGQPSALAFKEKLEKKGMRTYLHRSLPGYPEQLDELVSESGFGSNPYVPVTNPLVVVTGPGPGSGKMGTCLSQIYHEFSRGGVGRYAKFETFPVWNLPLNHPVNLAYEAATADLLDYNAIDSFHHEAYGIVAVNYNRDLQTFPLLRAMLTRLTGSQDGYQSPTDMGVNCIFDGIVDDEAVRRAANEEIIRRYFQYNASFQLSTCDEKVVARSLEILQKAGLRAEDRPVVKAARLAAKECEEKGRGDGGIYCGAAIKLKDGTIITGKNSSLMHSAASMILNASKYLANLPDSQHLLLPDIVDSVSKFKTGLGTSKHTSLNLNETLIALVVSASRDLYASRALACLSQLQNCDVHFSHIPGRGDEAALRHLGVCYTYDPLPPTRDFFA